MLSLSIGSQNTQLVINENSSSGIKAVKTMKLSLTGVATVFEEDCLVNFLSDLSKLIEQPLMISL